MDEINASWFRWIADRAHYVFWIIWGAGFGAFGLILAKAIDPAGLSPPAYLSVLTVFMGGALGLVTSRSMDRLTDLRKQRRKQYLARYRMRAMRLAMIKFVDFISEHTENGRVDLTAAKIPVSVVRRYAVLTGRIQTRALTPPDFEDLIDADDDIDVVDLCVGVFENCSRVFNIHDLHNLDVGVVQLEMENRVSESGIQFFKLQCERLERAEAHFAKRHQ